MKDSTKPAGTLIALKPPSVEMFWLEVQKLTNQVRERAYYLYQSCGCVHGRDLDDWLRAESELLKPVPAEILRKDDLLQMRIYLPGVRAEELEMNLEPTLLTIKGLHRGDPSSKMENSPIGSPSRPVFRQIYLPVTVIPEGASAALLQEIVELTAPTAESAGGVDAEAA